MPDGESLIHSPFGNAVYIPIFALITIGYAVSCEWRSVRILPTQRAYWSGYGYLILMVTLYFTFFESFGYLKSLIPTLNPFYLDPILHRMELALHGGISPTQWLITHLPPSLIQALAYIYSYGWGVAILAYFIWQLCVPPSQGRSQFISCSILMWIYAGIVLATFCASVGPIYYSEFYQDSHSALNHAMVEHLRGMSPEFAHSLFWDIRNLLLTFHHDQTLVNINGISAMPSLHTGIAMLMALHSLTYAKRLAYLMVPFALSIMLGSVALAWHYALDTYVSAIVLAIVWHINKRSMSSGAP